MFKEANIILKYNTFHQGIINNRSILKLYFGFDTRFSTKNLI